MATGKPPKAEEKEILIAALMAMGTNISFDKMADSSPQANVSQMYNLSEWRMHDDALKQAQSVLVNFLKKLPLPYYWGDGSTSSSDGMRVQVSVSSLYSDANPHYGTGKGMTIYRFISDQYSAFYTKIINTNARDAILVLDGLLEH
jgi:TnpA family transposase